MTDSDNSTGNFEVGYGKPPKHTQFPPGVSGNPKGRPRRKRADEIDVAALLDSEIAAVQNGKQRNVSVFEALFRKQLSAGLSGNIRSLKWVVRRFEEFGLLEPVPDIHESPVVIIPKEMKHDEFVEKAAASGMTLHEFSAFVIENREEDAYDSATS